jgi:hypothetical protein
MVSIIATVGVSAVGVVADVSPNTTGLPGIGTPTWWARCSRSG